MKVLFLEPCPKNFGGYYRAKNICDNLSKLHHQVDLLTTSDQRFSLRVKKTKINNNFYLYELPRIYFNNFIQGRLLRAFISIIFSITHHYDIYHIGMVVEPETNIPALFLKLIGKKNIIIDWDDTYEDGVFKNNYLLHKYIQLCEHNFPRLFPNFCVVSQVLYNLAVKNGCTNPIKIINAVNTDQIKIIDHQTAQKELNLNNKYKYLLTFGNSYVGNRIFLLYQTVKEITQLDNSFRLICNFNPEEILIREGFKKQIDPKLFKFFINVGYLSGKTLDLYLGASDATILLMDYTDLDRGSFPTRIGTFLAGEKIIILNDNQGEAVNTLKPLRCLISDPDYRQLAKKVVESFNKPQLMKRLQQNSKIAKSTLSYYQQVKILTKYYRAILSKSSN